MTILASTRIRQKWRIFGEYSNSTNSPASGQCLIERQGAVNVFLKVKIIKALMRNNVRKTELLLFSTEVSGEKERRSQLSSPYFTFLNNFEQSDF
jgi:hypothetical protein